jgi:hypothetical protein
MIEIETEIAMRGRVVKESCTRAQLARPNPLEWNGRDAQGVATVCGLPVSIFGRYAAMQAVARSR